MILKFIVEHEALRARLMARKQNVFTAVVRKMDALMIMVESKIVTQKLAGQVLHHRSGKLAGSVHHIPATIEGNTITGGVAAAAGPAWYGKVHERGGTHAFTIVPVNKQALRFMMGTKEVFAKRVLHPPLPKRSFMESTLREEQTRIASGLREAVVGALR